jgi:hypothetical protein
MMNDREPMQHEKNALHGCPMLCTVLGLRGMACLAASSSSLTDACESIIRLQPHEWMQLAVKSAQAAQLRWVLKAAPAAVAGAAERLVRMPGVQLHMAKVLIAAGVCISYAQLIAAANKMVAGVEVWVQAQQQLGVDSDIPAVAEDICNSGPYVVNENLVSCRQAPLLSSLTKDMQREHGHCRAEANDNSLQCCFLQSASAGSYPDSEHVTGFQPSDGPGSFTLRADNCKPLLSPLTVLCSSAVCVHAARAAACWRQHCCAAAAGHEWQQPFDSRNSSSTQHASTA